MDIQQRDEGHVDGEEVLTFYYNRAERIAHAPQIVQDYYSGKMKIGRQGIFKSLVATRGNRLVFIMLGVCFAVVLMVSLFGPQKNQGTVHGVPVQLVAFSFMDTVYTSVTFDDALAKYAETVSVPISAEFSFVDGDGTVVQTEKISGKYDGKQQKLATTFTDYDILEVRTSVQVAEESILLSSSIKKD